VHNTLGVVQSLAVSVIGGGLDYLI